MKRLWFLISVMLSIPLVVDAATYHTAKTGSDSTSCANADFATSTRAKLTIAAAAACMTQAGDQLLIHAGTYTEAMLGRQAYGSFPWRSGAAGNYTRYAKYATDPAGSVIIRPSSGPFVIAMYDAGTAIAYIEIDGLVLDGVNLNNTTLKIEATFGNTHHIRVQNCDINGLNGNALLVEDYDGEILRNNIHHAGGYGVYATGDRTIIDGNTIHDNGGYAIHYYKDLGSPQNGIVRNNTMYNNGGDTGNPSGGRNPTPTLIVAGSGHEVYNNVSYNNYGGFQINATNVKVYSNTLYNNTPGIEGRGFIVAGGNGDDGNNAIIRNNIGWQNTGNSVVVAGSITITQSNNLTASNPGFVSVAGGAEDFHIAAAGSPAVNAGFTLGAPYNVDKEGATRPTAQYTVGAYQFGAAPPATIGTIAKYTFDEGTGTTAADSSGNPAGPHNCTLNTAGWTTGIIGSFALNANGARECHVTTTADMRPTATMGIKVWFNGGTPPGYGYLVDVGGARGLWHDPLGIIYGYINTSSGVVGVQSTASVLTGTNQMVTLTKDAQGLRLWVGTSQVGFTPTTASILYSGSESLYISRNGVNNQEYFTGTIDAVDLTDTALDQAAVNSYFNQAPVGSAGVSVTHMRYFDDVAAEGIPLNNVNLDTDVSVVVGKKLGIRFSIHNQGSTITEYFPLWCNRNNLGFAKVTNSFGSLGLRIATSTFVNMGDQTAAILPLDGFASIPGRFVADVINTAITTTLASGQHAEWEFRIESGSPAIAGDTYVCEPRRQADTVFDNYNNQLKTLALVGIAAPSAARLGGIMRGGIGR